MLCRRAALLLSAAAALAWFPAAAQSVIATHSGVLYFFEGSVFIGDTQVEQRFGRFPDIGEGRELRTGRGRAEVLLTPGVFLRIGDNTSIRMVSSRLSDTRVELLGGSAIVEAGEPAPDTSVTLIHKNWQVRIPDQGVYRIDSEPPQVQVYKGAAEVAAEGEPAVRVQEGQELPLAAVLVPEASSGAADAFKTWSMNRSRAVAADNAIAGEIVDDPSQFDTAGLAVAGVTYFPPTGIPSQGIINPYGLSFWSPYQSLWNSIYFPPVVYVLYPGWWGGLQNQPLRPWVTSTPSRISGVGRPGGVFPSPPVRSSFAPRPIAPLGIRPATPIAPRPVIQMSPRPPISAPAGMPPPRGGNRR